MRVNMNQVIINGEHQKLIKKAARWSYGVCGRVLVVIQYSIRVLVVRSGYTSSVVV